MKTNQSPSPTAVSLELELELRQSGEQLRDSREKLREAERRASTAHEAAQRADAVFNALSSAVGGGLQLAPALGDLAGQRLPAEGVAIAQEAWQIVGKLDSVMESAVSEAESVVELLRARNRSIIQEEAGLDGELNTVRAQLLRQRGI